MDYDYEALDLKRKELLAVAEAAVRGLTVHGDVLADFATTAFVELTPPTKPKLLMHLIVLNVAGQPKGESQKPGNIYLNWRKLIEVTPDVTLAGAGAVTAPSWLLPLIALHVWNKLRRAANEDLTEIEASIIFALWKSRNADNQISESDGYIKTNLARDTFHLPLLSQEQYAGAITRLIRLGCIEATNGMLWLREWVRISYTRS